MFYIILFNTTKLKYKLKLDIIMVKNNKNTICEEPVIFFSKVSKVGPKSLYVLVPVEVAEYMGMKEQDTVRASLKIVKKVEQDN